MRLKPKISGPDVGLTLRLTPLVPEAPPCPECPECPEPVADPCAYTMEGIVWDDGTTDLTIQVGIGTGTPTGLADWPWIATVIGQFPTGTTFIWNADWDGGVRAPDGKVSSGGGKEYENSYAIVPYLLNGLVELDTGTLTVSASIQLPDGCPGSGTPIDAGNAVTMTVVEAGGGS